MQISNNLLNLPSRISVAEQVRKYRYLLDGTKLEMRDSTTNNGYAYLGSARYTVSNGVATFESVPFAMGRIRKDADGYAVHAYITDHVGNTRAIVDGINQTVIAKFDYTPFGVCTADTTATATTDYRLTGKELQNITDTELYDFGARYYLPEYATWTSQDPLAEEDYNIGSYNYCASDPINRIDKDGQEWYSYDKIMITDNGTKYTKTQYEYRECKMSDKEMEEGEYIHLGYTYTDKAGMYYSLLGDIKDSSSDEGKLYVAIDQAIINHYVVKQPDIWSCEPAYEQATDFSGIKRYNKNIFGSGNNLYRYPNSYAGTDMYFYVYKTTMKGRYVPPTAQKYGSPNYMGAILPAAYYGYIRVAGSSNNNIIYLPFKDKNELSIFQNKINNIFR